MTSWIQKLKGAGGHDVPHQKPRDVAIRSHRQRALPNAPQKDVNVPKKRFQIHQKCLYERTLPGQAFISAHVNRLQHGYYESTSLHEDNMDNVYFVSVHFVFHPRDPRAHRFKSAEIRVRVHGDDPSAASRGDTWKQPPTSNPRILKHAPELMYGAVSPENLQWNFSLSSSLGVAQTPVSATVNPAGGVKGSYKLFHMMSIQGSLRSNPSLLGPDYDIEDGMAVWTLEENILQRSGLPREFDFVLLVHKPDDIKNVYLTVDVDAEVEAWFGTYPMWFTNLARYMPTQDYTLDFNTDIGQRFLPSQPGRGFNFGSLPHPLDEYVTMPGTVYPTDNTKEPVKSFGTQGPLTYQTIDGSKVIEASPTSPQAQQPLTPPPPPPNSSRTPGNGQAPIPNRHSLAAENLNIHVVLEHQYPQQISDPRRFSYSPPSNYEPSRYPSIRRRKSRTGLKEYGAKQALQELAQNALEENYEGNGSIDRPNRHL